MPELELLPAGLIAAAMLATPVMAGNTIGTRGTSQSDANASATPAGR